MNAAGGERSQPAKALAERALARLCQAAGHRSSDLVLIGGLVPELLVESDDPHQGTIDVDILLDIGVVYDRDDLDFAWLERALGDGGFVQQTPNVGWRWVCDVDGFPVLVEFLVDVSDSPDQEIALPGAGTLGAKNLAGPGPVLRRTAPLVIAGSELRVADLGGYLTAKAAAVFRRAAVKDYYDFAWVLVRSVADDPDAAAGAVLSVLSPAEDRDRFQVVVAACARFREPTDVGPVAYARASLEAGSIESPDLLAEDAVIAVGRFHRGLARDT